jgi:hypothetical protein
VPNDQVAMLHKGEAVIPEQYNQPMGNLATEMLNAGAEIGRQIAQALAGVEVKAVLEDNTVKLDTDTVSVDTTNLVEELNAVKLQVEEVRISNVDELSDSLRTALESVNLKGAGVGAEESNKLDEFMSEIKDKLDQYDTRSVEQDGKLTELTDQLTLINVEDVSKSLESLEEKVTGLESEFYNKSEKPIDDTQDRSYLETRLHDLYSELKSEKAQSDSELAMVKADVNVLKSSVNDTFDRLFALSNRVDIK